MTEDIHLLERKLLKKLAIKTEQYGELYSSAGLEASDFRTSPLHRLLYSGLMSLYNQHRTPDRQTLEKVLSSSALRNEERISDTLALFEELISPTNIEEIEDESTRKEIDLLLGESLRKEALEILREASRKLSSSSCDPHQAVLETAKFLTDRLGARRYDAFGSAGDEIEKLLPPAGGTVSGHNLGFPLLNKKINGIENELYILAGASGMGKTTFVTQLAWQLVSQNPDLTLLFFSLDQSTRDILCKFVSEAGGAPISYVKNPNPRNEIHEIARKKGIEIITSLGKRLKIIDESRGEITLRSLKNIVRRERLLSLTPLVVVVDTLFLLKTARDFPSLEEKYSSIIAELRGFAREEQVGILATMNLTSAAEKGRPRREDFIKVPPSLSDAYITMSIYCDFILDRETPLIEWEWGTADMMVPIVELDILKNKMGEFRGRLFYRYLNSLASFRECVEVENENYNLMIENLEAHKEKKRRQALQSRSGQEPPEVGNE